MLTDVRPSPAEWLAMYWFQTQKLQKRTSGGRCVITSASSSARS